jgi:hypothetical protein
MSLSGRMSFGGSRKFERTSCGVPFPILLRKNIEARIWHFVILSYTARGQCDKVRA